MDVYKFEIELLREWAKNLFSTQITDFDIVERIIWVAVVNEARKYAQL